MKRKRKEEEEDELKYIIQMEIFFNLDFMKTNRELYNITYISTLKSETAVIIVFEYLCTIV